MLQGRLPGMQHVVWDVALLVAQFGFNHVMAAPLASLSAPGLGPAKDPFKV